MDVKGEHKGNKIEGSLENQGMIDSYCAQCIAAKQSGSVSQYGSNLGCILPI